MKTFLMTALLGASCAVSLANDHPQIMARCVVGNVHGGGETDVVVTGEDRKIVHHHSDFQGGGIWYDAVIAVRDGNVTIVERDSVSSPYKSGSKVSTTENIYRLPVDKIDKEEVQLSHGNRVVMTKAIKVAQPPAGGDGKPAPQP